MITRRLLLGGAAAAAGAALMETSAVAALAEDRPLRVLCWSERTEPGSIYPNGINGTVAEFLNKLPNVKAKTANLDDPDQGLSDSTLDEVDVITWFGHKRHDQVHDDRVAAMIQRMHERGLGFLALH